MATSDGTFSRHCNRHHLLYPARAWRAIGPNALILRGAFIIRINEELHTELHRELDRYLGDYVTRKMLPRKNVIKHIKKEYRRREWEVRAMDPIEKLEWLESEIDPNVSRNRWLFRMLDMQRRFLITHREEI